MCSMDVMTMCRFFNLFNFVALFWGILWEQPSTRQMRSFPHSQGLEMQPKSNISWLLGAVTN